MEFDITQVTSLGLGAVIALVVLTWKRIDDARYAATLRQLVEERDRRFDLMLDAFRENSEALRGLSDAIGQLQDTDKIMTMVEDRIRAGTGPLGK